MQPDDSELTWDKIRSDFIELKYFLRDYVKNPIQFVKTIPDWDWPKVLLLQSSAAAITGILYGLINRSLSSMIFGLISYPILAVLLAAIGAGALYYLCLFIFKKELPYRSLFTIIVLADLPFIVLTVVSNQLPPIDLIGGCAVCLLLIVSLSSNFGIDRRQLTKWIFGVYAIFILAWGINTIRTATERRETKLLATPKSFEILEKELREGK